MGKCKFSSAWVVDDRFKGWIAPVLGRSDRAHCVLCSVDFDVSNMGVAAVVSHKDGKKHSQREQQRQTSPTTRFVTSGSKGGSSSSQTSGVSEVNSQSDSTIGPAPDAVQSTMSSFVCQEAVTAAELQWALLQWSGTFLSPAAVRLEIF